jgi:hypothetical protein
MARLRANSRHHRSHRSLPNRVGTCWALTILVTCFPCFAHAGSAVPVAASLPEGAEYYAPPLALAYSDLVMMMEVTDWCSRHFPGGCVGPDPRTDPMVLGQVLENLRLITIFYPSMPKSEFAYTSVDDARRSIAKHVDDFMAHQRAYDEDFLAKYAAVVHVCPDATRDATEKLINITGSLELERYWGMSVDDYNAEAKRANLGGKLYLAEPLSWSAERCNKTRLVGRRLLTLLYKKLRPYNQPDWEKYIDTDKVEQGTAYIWLVALNFEAQVHPEVLDKVLNESALTHGAN